MTKLLYVALLLILISSNPVAAQPDFDEIKQATSDPNSPSYYPLLIQRLQDSDSTLTPEDFELIYYGAVFSDHYNPTAIEEVEKQIRQANYDGEYLKAYDLADSLLQKYPVSVQAYFEKAYACYNLKRFDEETYNNKRYKILLKTILASGDGKSYNSAFYANLLNDELETLKFLRLEYKEVSEIEFADNSYDAFSLKPNKLKCKEIYFNVSHQRGQE